LHASAPSASTSGFIGSPGRHDAVRLRFLQQQPSSPPQHASASLASSQHGFVAGRICCGATGRQQDATLGVPAADDEQHEDAAFASCV
ncbi:hypothetical protein GGI05_007321, partial [Coemansia sp. RSA 2603]